MSCYSDFEYERNFCHLNCYTAPEKEQRIENYSFKTFTIKNTLLKIIKYANSSSKPPYANGFLCVQLDRLGKNNFPFSENFSVTNVMDIYNIIVRFVTLLTIVGTWHYERRLLTDGGHKVTTSASGKAIFTNNPSYGYLRNLDNPQTLLQRQVQQNNLVTASSIHDFINEVYNVWDRTNKHHNVLIEEYCHDSCHSSCHSSCHYDCYGNDHGGSCKSCHTNDSGRCNWNSGGSAG